MPVASIFLAKWETRVYTERRLELTMTCHNNEVELKMSIKK